jgi:hypothetical protein
MNRRKKLAVKSMHPMDLYHQAMEGCDVSLVELIDRQQEKRGIRLYPEGRDGVFDDAAIPIRLKVTNTSVVARSGQPSIPIQMDSECLSIWVIGMAECMEWLLKKVAEDQSLEASEAAKRVNDVSTGDFDVSVKEVKGSVYVRFLPVGAAKWKVPVWGALHFVSESLAAVEKLGWKIKGTQSQLDTVQKFSDYDCSDLWDLISDES